MADTYDRVDFEPQHIEERPSWDCRACGQPWPCEIARKELKAELSPTLLSVHMWTRLEVAAEDEPDTSAAALFRRFIGWTG